MTNNSRLEGETAAGTDLADPLFGDGLDLQTGRLIVWGVNSQQISRVLMYLRARGLEFDKEKLYRKASALIHHFELDVGRQRRSRCTFCNDFLPADDYQLCECFLRAVPGVYIEPTILAIEQEKLSFPNTWATRLQSTYICSNNHCMRLNDLALGVVASDLRKLQIRYNQQLSEYNLTLSHGDLRAVRPKEPVWRPKTKCHACYMQEQKTGSRRSSAPPPARISDRPREGMTLASLIQTLPPTAES